MWSPSDEALLAGLAAGDARAAATFVRRHQARVYGLARSVVGDPAAAEEVAQEAFLRIWRHAGAYDHRRGRVVTWMLTITRNLAIDRLRLRRPDPIDPDKLDGMQLMMMRPPAEQDEAAEELGPLKASLATLPAEQRRAVILASLYGYTAKEIGELDGTPVGTVKSRIRSALSKLRSERGVGDER